MTTVDAARHMVQPAPGASRPPDGKAWDLLVVGGGTAGIVGAKTAAGLGASVLLVEEDRTGGDCLWTGCVPSKALLAAGHAAAEARSARRLGVDTGEVRVDFARVRRHVRAAIEAIQPEDDPEALRSAGVRVTPGRARFTGPDSVEIATLGAPRVPVRFRHALIATGSAPLVPPIPGLDPTRVLTSDTVWDVDSLPGRLLVLGGGSIGCELGQAFARLGSRVTIVEAGPRILPRESEQAARVLSTALREDEVDLRTHAAAVRVVYGDDGVTLVLDDEAQLEGDALLVAVGRAPRTGGLGLTAAGVVTTDRGHVRVDSRLCTSNRRVFAAGDVTGHPQFTHVAGVHAQVAATNAVLGLRRCAETAIIPRMTFTQPEVAAFGVSPNLAGPDRRLSVHTIGHSRVDRAVADGRSRGFTQLVLDARGRILGATIVGPRAGESLPELVLAAGHGLRARDVAGAIHAYPTYGDGVWKVSIQQVLEQLARPVTGRVIAGLRRLRRLRTH